MVRRSLRRERRDLPGHPRDAFGFDLSHVELTRGSTGRDVESCRSYPGLDDGITVDDREDGARHRRADAGATCSDAERRHMSARRRRRERRRARRRAETGCCCCCSRVVAHRSPTRWSGSGSAGACRANIVALRRRVRAGLPRRRGASCAGRARAPTRCSYPIAVMLGGLGLAMLYRLLTPGPGVADEQASGSRRAGRVRPDARARPRRSASSTPTRTRSGSPGWSCCCCRSSPGSGLTVNGARLWVHLGSSRSSRPSSGKILIVIFLASLPVGQARAARGRRRAARPAAREGPRAAAPRVGRLARRPVPRARPGRLAAASSACSS